MRDTKDLSKELDIEAGVLASMMLEPKYIPMIRAIVMAKCYFIYPEHKHIFQAICDAWEDYSDENTLLVQAKNLLNTQGLLESVGGVEYLLKIGKSIASAKSWEYYAKELKEQHVKRQLLRCSQDIMVLANSPEPASVAIQKAQGCIKDVIIEDDSEALASMSDIEDIPGTFEAGSFISTGINTLDVAVKGPKKGEVWIVAARPAMGKTVLAVDLAINMAKAKHPSVIFSLEMKEIELKQRIVCNQTAQSELKLLRTKPLYIDACPRLTPNMFHAKLMQYKAKHGIEVAVIDYLGLMQSDEKSKGLYEKYTEITNELKRIAKEEDVALILVCQLNRGPENRENKRPNMGDLRDSGAIEQNADVVMMLYRDDYYTYGDTGDAEVIFTKVRRGPPQTCLLRFCPEYTRFEDR
jgi:replicative DNA helicase